MAEPPNGPASYWTQANALLRKNLTYQKRKKKTTIRLICDPFILCLLLVLLQRLVNHELDQPSNRCGCQCVDTAGNGQCQEVCGIQYSTTDQVGTCPIPNPPEWPLLLQVPTPQYRAVMTDFFPSNGLPNSSCRTTGSCPATILFTGSNQSLGETLAGKMVPGVFTVNTSDLLIGLAQDILGTASWPQLINYLEPAFFSDLPVYNIIRKCSSNSTISVPFQEGLLSFNQDLSCVQGLQLWRNSSGVINDELYKGYWKGNPERKINEITAAFDFLNTDGNNFNVSIWYNSTYKNDTGNAPPALLRVMRSVNLASNAYLQFLRGPATKILLEFVKEMPKPETQPQLDFSSLLSPSFFAWIILLLFPVILTALVYEKSQNLRIMMKMHGLGDGPYWLISYVYFLAISSAYMLCFVIFGSVIGLKFFTLNDYSIQFVFYFIYINLQIALAFLAAGFFSNVKTATVVGNFYVFGTGLSGGFLFNPLFRMHLSQVRGWIIVMELFPGFSLYRGLYEFSQYAFIGYYMGTKGMRWGDLSASTNGMKVALIIMVVEWLFVLLVAYYIDQVQSTGNRTSLLFFLKNFQKKRPSSFHPPSLRKQGSQVFVDMETPDVAQEKETVEHLLLEPSINHTIICDSIKKWYPGRDGNPEKFAVRGLSLALPRGECFGMLGPNGAGKTSFISMMIGLTEPTAGMAYVQGLDIRNHMGEIYTSMGVCPQHDLLWETLTGREHLLFYGRLKNLKGPALLQAVEESLKSFNLFYGGVADKQAGKYSGGMKRRLSVAISLIGDPKVVYMDEPSTGLDPASRNNLWNVVKCAKQNRAIILTTHSMEEAEVLCDRIGIFVNGSMKCLGNPNELKARYGGSYVFMITTSSDYEEEVERMVQGLSPGAKRIYHISGTQKFEMPKQEVKIPEVFQAVESVKSRFEVFAWGLADTTLEDVFIKVAHSTEAINVLS